ncbi:putative bifunctional diguanylate cyclase/phosphodiesterase [Aureimonas psammosilenae]|uniref:putative bifunctional diguanylate cyclase/phosphodiesterase n=1 Tax=Aureimonas psammosilenae TaxID=2495496 RepID=UPI001260A4E6|nr:bifunctional diguanylate cyclase/phosphodiesterase [Aureimonas psammosilenae]
MKVRSSGEVSDRSKIVRKGLIALTSVLAVLAVLCSLLASRYQQEMIAASRYNQAFDFSQASVELLRLQMAIAESAEAGGLKKVELRSSILHNRINVVQPNTLLDEADRTELFQQLRSTLDSIKPLMTNGVDPVAIRTAIQRLEPFVTRLSRVASRAHAESGDKVLQNQQDLGSVLESIRILTIALLVVGTSLVVVVLRQNKLLDKVVRTDALTGLANRRAFNADLGRLVDQKRSLVVVDVDHFKAINDSLGHDAGDQLLCIVASRLRDAAEGAHALARIGGDEFAVLFAGKDAEEQSLAFSERASSSVRVPVFINGREIVPTVTQGLCVAGEPDSASLFNDADIALYAAKVADRGTFLVFEPNMKLSFLRRQRLLEDMRQAIERAEFFLLYQPIVDLGDGRPRGFEALLRWQHSELGLISPAEFIPIAEESGLIEEVGRWVIEEACRQAACWPDEIFVAVNVSARQLTDRGLSRYISECLERYDISQGRLEIEITESTLIGNDESVLGVLDGLQELGCRISLDDFGTGYASLSYLRRFHFNKIKIDQSFVRENAGNTESVAIISMICTLADQLGLTIVAEGIETLEQRQIVSDAGSHLGQGYLFDRPLSGQIATDMVRSTALTVSATALTPQDGPTVRFSEQADC